MGVEDPVSVSGSEAKTATERRELNESIRYVGVWVVM